MTRFDVEQSEPNQTRNLLKNTKKLNIVFIIKLLNAKNNKISRNQNKKIVSTCTVITNPKEKLQFNYEEKIQVKPELCEKAEVRFLLPEVMPRAAC